MGNELEADPVKWVPVEDTVGQTIRRERGLRNWSLAELADRLEEYGYPLSFRLLSRLETGERKICVDDVVAIADVFGTSVAHLLYGEHRHASPAVRARERKELELWTESTLSQIDGTLRSIGDAIRDEAGSVFGLGTEIRKYRENGQSETERLYGRISDRLQRLVEICEEFKAVWTSEQPLSESEMDSLKWVGEFVENWWGR